MGATWSLPDDTIALAASFVEKSDYLNLRALSTVGRDAVRRTRSIISEGMVHMRLYCVNFTHAKNKTEEDGLALKPRAIEAVARVQGAACGQLQRVLRRGRRHEVKGEGHAGFCVGARRSARKEQCEAEV